MVYVMKFYTDGVCRRNGHPGVIGAAAAVLKPKFGNLEARVRSLSRYPPPTNQRAEITAIIVALEKALEIFDSLDSNPWLDVTIYSDSRYAVDCMTKWIYKWSNNGWINSLNNPVANRNLLMNASGLDDMLKEEGTVEYIWIPREDNGFADRLCNENMDEQEDYRCRHCGR